MRCGDSLAQQGVGTGVHYPLAVHQQPAYREAAGADALPVTERACREIFSLPMFPQLTDDVPHIVAKAILKCRST